MSVLTPPPDEFDSRPARIEIGKFIPLKYDDPTPASADLRLVTPATETEPAVYALDLVIHEGPPVDPNQVVGSRHSRLPH